MSGNVVELVESISGNVVELAEAANDSGGSNPGARYAYWSSSSPAITEGDSFKLTVNLSEADEFPRACVVTATANTTTDAAEFSFTPTEVLFPAGSTEASVTLTTTANAAAGSSTLIELFLDAQAELTENPDAFPVQTTAKSGPDKVQVTVEDQAVTGAPEFYIAGAPAQTYEEGSGSRSVFVVLDEPAIDDVTLSITSTDGTASSTGPDALFVAINETVTIKAGSQRGAGFLITILDNDLAEGATDFTVSATLVSGTATPRAGQDTLTVTVSDNDSGVDIPRVEFQTSSQVVPEGTAIDVVARVVDVFGNAMVFAGEQFVDVSSTTTGTKNVDYVEDWGTQTPGTLRFAPGTGQQSFRVTVLEDSEADIGEEVAYTIDPAPAGAKWAVGPASTLTLTFGEAIGETAELLLPQFTGAATTRRVIQGVCAIVPPQQTLPTYAIDKGSSPGEKVQLVGLKRNAAGEWISARFYAMHDNAESLPRTTSALKLRPFATGDIDPTEAGTFPDWPRMQVKLRPSNTANDYVGDLGGGLTYPGTIEQDWMSPTGTFVTTGPRLCEERVWLMRPRSLAVADTDASGSGDYCALVQIGLKRFAGDTEVIMASGRLLNGAWSKTADPFAENPDCDGELYFEYLKLESLDTWDLTLPVAHPGQAVVDSLNVDLLPARSTSYFMRNCAQYQFHFALKATGAGAAAVERARDYWKCKHAAWAVGPLGSTHQRIYGEACEETIDYGRPEVGFADGSQSGWLGIKAIGDYQGNGDGGASYAGMTAIWQAGSQAPYTASLGAYDGTRQGWWQPSYIGGAGAAGNDGIYGQLATVPWWGFWLRQRCAMSGTFARTRVSYRDVGTGNAPYWWELARTVDGSVQVPLLGGLEDRTGSARHWHFNTLENATSYALWDTSAASDYRLAPTTRPWNTFEAGEDPARSSMNLFPSEHPTHWGRVRNELSDCWEVLGEWLAFSCWEELAAFYSRTQAPCGVERSTTDGLPNQKDLTTYNSRNAAKDFVFQGALRNLGYWPVLAGSSTGRTVPTDAVAWMLDILGGFIQCAPSGIRSEFIGRGVATTPIPLPNNVVATLSDVLSSTSMSNGVLFRSTSTTPAPNPYLGTDDAPSDPEAFQPTNLSGRTGALPSENSSDSAERDSAAAYQRFYQHLFYVKGLTAWAIATELDLTSLPAWMLETFRSHDNYRQGAATFSSIGGAIVQPNYVIVARGPVVSGNNPTQLEANTLTDASVRAGDAVWQVLKPGETEEDITAHQNKAGVSGSLGAIYASDPSIATLTQDVFKRQADTQQEFLDYCVGLSNVQNGGVSFAFNIANQSGGRRRKVLGEHTWMAGYIAYLQNIIS